MTLKEAIYLFDKYANCRGLVKAKDIIEEGFSIREAEMAGIVIKEDVPKYTHRVSSEKCLRPRRRRKKCEILA